jgi:MFS family permease
MAVLAHLVAALGFVLSGFTTSLAMLIAMRVVSGLGKARDSLQPSASPSIAPALNCAHASRRTCGVAAD